MSTIKLAAREPYGFYRKQNLSTTLQVAKSERSQLHGWTVHNPNAAEVWIQLFDRIPSDITLGTTAADYTIKIPELGSVHFTDETPLKRFNTQCVIAATTTETGSTAPTTAVSTTLFFDK